MQSPYALRGGKRIGEHIVSPCPTDHYMHVTEAGKVYILWEPGEGLIHLLYPGIQEGMVVGWISTSLCPQGGQLPFIHLTILN